MKQYNRSLDFMVSAAVKLAQGKTELAAKLLLKATREPSFARAVQIIEASNAQAFHVEAKAAEKRKLVKAAEVAEDSELEGLVGDMDDLGAEEEVEGAFEPEGEPEEVEDESIEEEDAEMPVEAKFAKTLASMKKAAARK